MNKQKKIVVAKEEQFRNMIREEVEVILQQSIPKICVGQVVKNILPQLNLRS